jgi:hypothetical protein
VPFFLVSHTYQKFSCPPQLHSISRSWTVPKSSVTFAITALVPSRVISPPASSMHVLRRVLILLFSFHLAVALKFDLIAQPPHSKNERCIRNFVNRDTLVVVTAILDGSRGDGQVVNMHVCSSDQSFWGIDSVYALRYQKRTDVCGFSQIKDSVGNDYGRPKDITGETRMAFTSLADTAFDVCFENNLATSSCMYFTNVPPLAGMIPAYAHQTRDRLPPDTSSSTSTLAPTPKTGPASKPQRS